MICLRSKQCALKFGCLFLFLRSHRVTAQQLGIYGKAPHLNGAKLFAEWMITPEGQVAVAAVGRETSRKGVKSKASVEYAWGDKVKPIPIVNKSFSEDPRKWLDANVKPVWEN